MIAIQLSVGKEYNNTTLELKWVNYSAGIWYTDFNANYTEKADTQDEKYYYIDEITEVSSIAIDLTIFLTQTDSIPTDDGYFYYDNGNNRVYITIDGWDDPDLHDVTIGISKYVSDQEYIDDDDNIYYPHLLMSSLPKIATYRDPLVSVGDDGENIISTDSFQFDIQNANGEYDYFNTWNIYKQPILAYYLIDGVRYNIFSGLIGDYTISEDVLTIRAIDKKQALDEVTTETYYYVGDFPNLHPDDDFKPMPQRWGLCRKVPIVCVNRNSYSETASQTLTFHVADTLHHNIQAIDNFYIEDVEKTIASTDTAAGTFTYSKPANTAIDFTKCTATIRGYVDDSNNLITNPADIIKDILETIADKDYNSTNYNTTRWVQVRTLLKNGYLDANEITIFEAISKVIAQNATFLIEPDGRYSLSKQDFARSPSYTIDKEEILNLQQLAENYNPAEVFARIKLDYANGLNYVYTANEADVIAQYKTRNIFKYTTSLSSESNVETLAEEMGNILSEIRPVYQLSLPLQNWHFLMIDDVISAQIDRLESTWRGYRNLIIESVQPSPAENRMYINARYVGDTVIEPDITASVKLGGEMIGGEMIGGGAI